MTRDVLETFSKCGYVSGKLTVLMIRHKIGVVIRQIKVGPLYLLKMWGNTVIPLKNPLRYYNKFGGGVILISQYIPNVPICSGTFRTDCISATKE